MSFERVQIGDAVLYCTDTPAINSTLRASLPARVEGCQA
jgi:hypothetical protein